MTLNDLFQDFITNKVNLKISSISTYTRLYEAQIEPSLGYMNLFDLNNKIISDYILNLLSTNLTHRYVKSITTLLFLLINFAKIKYKQYINLNDIVKIPFGIIKKDIKIYSEEEQLKIEDYALSNLSAINVGILFCLYTGIRNGELCALKVKEINLNQNSVHIQNTLQRIKNIDNHSNKKTKIVIEKAKSESSVRDIPLPQFLTTILKNLFKNVDSNSFILTLSTYKFIEPRNMENQLKNFLEKCGVEYKKVHALRHTFATNMLNLGVDIKTLSVLLGHSNVTITMNEYLHPSFELKAKQIDLLNQKFLSKHK